MATDKRLTPRGVQALKAEAKPKKYTDGGGLFLLVVPSKIEGAAPGKLWRWNYLYQGKNKTLAIGAYPDVGVEAARAKRDEARAMLKAGVDPIDGRKQAQIAAAAEVAKLVTFKQVFERIETEQWFLKLDADSHKCYRSGLRYCAALHDKPLPTITAADIKNMFDDLISPKANNGRGYARGTVNKVGKMTLLAVIDHGLANEIIDRSPMEMLRARRFKIKGRKTKSHPAIIAEPEVGELLRAIDGYPDGSVGRLLWTMPYLFARPTEIRLARWDEVDFENAIWTVPAERMKGQDREAPHYVPLPRQVLERFRAWRAETGDRSPFIFPGKKPGGNISFRGHGEALIALGYGGRHTGHGFRTTASSRLSAARRWSVDAIELQLDHRVGGDGDGGTRAGMTNNIRAIYMREPMMAERIEMMQWWADYLDGLRTPPEGVNVHPISTAAERAAYRERRAVRAA